MPRLMPAFFVVAAMAAPVCAQPVDLPIPAATTDQYPPGVTVRQTKSGPVYADQQGRTLYGMDMRLLLRWSPDPALYCKDECAKNWEPLLAPADAKPNIIFPRGFGGPPPGAGQAGAGAAAARPAAPAATQGERAPGQAPLPVGMIMNQRAPDWTIIQGPSGPTWVYKGWHVVYVRKGDKPGSTTFDGAEDRTWNTLKFVPPVPKLVAPSSVATAFADGAYVLTDKNGHVLFSGSCQADCATWQPLTAPMGGRGVGEWSVSLAGDSPQWALRGQPVYVSQEDDPLKAPRSGAVLRP